jgi:RNA polymerase sigma-32 factor
MQNFLIKTWSLVKIGTTQAQRKLFFKLNQAKKRLQKMDAKSPEFAEIAESLSVKEAEIEEMDVRLNSRDLSLDAFIDDDGELSHINCLADKSESQEDSFIRHEETALVKRNVAGALAKLNDREAYIIRHRVMSESPKTLQEIGDRFKITRERARQVEKEALRKMRQVIGDGEPETARA